MPQAYRLTRGMQSLIIRAYRANRALNTEHLPCIFGGNKEGVKRLIERGYAVECRAPLVPYTGYKLTAAGVRFAKTGLQIGEDGPE